MTPDIQKRKKLFSIILNKTFVTDIQPLKAGKHEALGKCKIYRIFSHQYTS